MIAVLNNPTLTIDVPSRFASYPQLPLPSHIQSLSAARNSRSRSDGLLDVLGIENREVPPGSGRFEGMDGTVCHSKPDLFHADRYCGFREKLDELFLPPRSPAGTEVLALTHYEGAPYVYNMTGHQDPGPKMIQIVFGITDGLYRPYIEGIDCLRGVLGLPFAKHLQVDIPDNPTRWNEDMPSMNHVSTSKRPLFLIQAEVMGTDGPFRHLMHMVETMLFPEFPDETDIADRFYIGSEAIDSSPIAKLMPALRSVLPR
jgi:hypothetical protein